MRPTYIPAAIEVFVGFAWILIRARDVYYCNLLPLLEIRPFARAVYFLSMSIDLIL